MKVFMVRSSKQYLNTSIHGPSYTANIRHSRISPLLICLFQGVLSTNYNCFMLSHFVFVVASLAATNGFLIAPEQSAINWPFTICGTGPWKMTSLTLSAQPSRNVNDEIIAVKYPST